MRVFHFVIKKRKRALRPIFLFFFNGCDIFKSIFILIITCLAIHHFQNVFRVFSILVSIGVQVFFCGFLFTLPLARDSLSRSPRALLRLTEKCRKIAPFLQIQASSMKLRVHGFLFLVFLPIKTDGTNRPFFITTSTLR